MSYRGTALPDCSSALPHRPNVLQVDGGHAPPMPETPVACTVHGGCRVPHWHAAEEQDDGEM